MTLTPDTKVCNCGACGSLLDCDRKQVKRHVTHGARRVPLCAKCSVSRDRTVIEAIQTFDTQREG